jgi:alpha-L-fucosidase
MKVLLRMFFIIVFVLSAFAQESPEQKEKRMTWFKNAKLGIFIHWGIYSVKGIDESWSFYNGYISYRDYMKQLDGFNAAEFNPDYWAEIIQQSGAKYAVITAKHHDGVALWDTKETKLNVVEKTPAGRDLIAQFCGSIRKKGLKVGIYFSQLDWSSKNYPHFTKIKKRYDPKENPDRWAVFLKFQQAQLKEVCEKFTPDLLWFDGDWDYNAELWKAREQRMSIFKLLPKVILNSRLNGYGDYATPEQGVPVCKPKDKWWELCLTMNDSWGYQPNDQNYKTPNQIIRLFADCISLGGNMLLDIGPKANGVIPDEQIRILKELGRWVKKHQEAVYDTKSGLPPGHFYGPSTLSEDRKTLYLFIAHRPKGPVLLKGLKNKINRIRVVGNGTKLKWDIKMKQYWSKVPGLVYITVPERVLDEQVTVLAILLEQELKLYRAYGQVIDQN